LLEVPILTNVDAVETIVTGVRSVPIPIVQFDPVFRVETKSRTLPVFCR
jgi:hypothetical protein